MQDKNKGKQRFFQFILILSFIITIGIKFVVSFRKGVMDSTPLNADNLDLLAIGCILSVIVFLFGTTISKERRTLKKTVCGFGLLSIVVHLLAAIIVVL